MRAARGSAITRGLLSYFVTSVVPSVFHCGSLRAIPGSLRALRDRKYVRGLDVLGANADADHASRDPAQERPSLQQPERPRDTKETARREYPGEHAVLHEHLYALSQSGRQLTAALNALQIVNRRTALSQGPGQEVRRGNSILNGEVDADPTNGRHGVRRVADAGNTRPG